MTEVFTSEAAGKSHVFCPALHEVMSAEIAGCDFSQMNEGP